MSDQPDKPDKLRDDQESSDPWSERMVLVVVGWIALVVLLPVHALLIYNMVVADWSFAFLFLLAVVALPLAAVDFFAIRWFYDNFTVMRWINRSGSRNGDESMRR